MTVSIFNAFRCKFHVDFYCFNDSHGLRFVRIWRHQTGLFFLQRHLNQSAAYGCFCVRLRRTETRNRAKLMLSSPQPLPQTSQPHALTRDGPRTGPVPSFNASVDELLTDTLSAVIMKGGLFLYLMLLDKRRTEKRWVGFKYHVYTSSISFCWILIVWNLKMFLLSEDNHILAQLFLVCWVGKMFPSLQMPLQVPWKQSTRARPDHSKPKGITIIGWRDSSLYSKSRSFRIFEESEQYGWALLQYVSILFRLFQMYRWWTLLDGLCTLDRLNVSRMNHRIHRYCREESHQLHSLILMV